MSDRVLYRCEHCGKFFDLADRFGGSIMCRYANATPETANWKIVCCECSTEWVYWIDVRDLFEKEHHHGSGNDTWMVRGPEAWEEHLREKIWFNSSKFFDAVARLADVLDAVKRAGVDVLAERQEKRAAATKPTIQNGKNGNGASLPLKIRFAVLKRDSFKCHYCGASGVELHVDHVVSRADGGTDDITNLVASCVSCNLGKGRESITPETSPT